MKTKEKEDANKKGELHHRLFPELAISKFSGEDGEDPLQTRTPTLVPSPLLPPPIENRLRRPFKALKS